MKPAGILWWILFCSVQLVAQQSPDSTTGPAIRYRYEMAGYFIKNRHLIRHLDTIVPVLFTELATAKTVDEHSKTDYILELQISAPTIIGRDFAPAQNLADGKESYNHNSIYSFHACLLLRNHKGQTIKYLDIIDSSLQFAYKTKHLLNGPAALLIPYTATVYDPQTKIKVSF